jgi:phospholipase B1
LIASGRYDTKEDFTVVLQPFMKKMKPPTTVSISFSEFLRNGINFINFLFSILLKKVFGTPDYSYFAPDCFHLSAKGHQAAAIELWNSMVFFDHL